MSNLEGQIFAGYEILSKLGQGGMGAVYKARQPMLNRLVALKMMAPNLSGDPAFVARFIREASAAANLNHPNMVQVYTAGENDKIYYIAMEFVEGESLRIRLDRMERIPPQEAVAVTVYIAQALQYAWNKAHLIHRDIKPDNIFLSNAGEVKVGDLGLAKSVGGGETTDMTQTGMVMGSPHYISPEQAQGLKDIDFRTDIYSLGCTLYHMLTGQTPYHGDSSMIVMMKHINDPPPAIFRVWPACPMPLGMLVGKMLAKDRNARPQSYEELVADLMQVHEKLRQSESVAPVATTPAPAVGGAAVSDTVPKAKQTGTAVTTQAKAGNRKLVYAAAGACALVALAGVLWWAPWKTPQRESVTVISQGQPLQPSEPPRQEVTASVTPPAPVAPPAQLAPATPSAPVADSAPRTPQSAVPPAIAPFDAAQARQHQEAWAKHLQVPVEMTNSIGMKFVLIPPGEFLMGSTPEERDRALDEASKVVKGRFYPDRIPGEVPQHRIRITKPFYLGVFEVTQEEYEQLAGKNPSQFAASGKQAAKIARMDTRRFPVEEVTFDDASQFAGRLSERAQEKSAGWKYRLPTEAEWEYACRAGTATRYHFGDDPSLLGDYGWFLGNSDHRTHPVGEKRPNAWGLHDMHGNALEWCQDWFSTTYFAESPADDPPGPSSGSVRVERGGTPILYPVGCRSASRHYQESGKPNYIGAGFRLVCEIPTSAEPKSATTPSTPAALASQPPASSAQAPPSPPSAAAAPTTDSFQSLFNGRDLTGWTPREIMGRGDAVTYRPATGGWVIQNGELACVTTSSGYLKSDRQYGDFILQLEFKLHSDGNSGFYIRCSEPGNLAHRTGMRVFINGSIADLSRPTPRFLRPVGQWNSMQIRCEGDDVEVLVNGVRTASVNMSREAKLRDRPRSGHIGITNWDGEANGMTFRNIRIKELGAAPASAVLAPPPPPSATTVQTTDTFQPLFNGRDLTGWVPMKTVDRNDSEHQPTTGGWNVRDGELVCATSENGWLKTERQYGDYVLQLEFKLLRNSNSDVYIRFPESGRVALAGMAIQILDPNYRGKQLPPEKLTGAIYGVVGSPQPPVRPPGEWNMMEIRCEGDNVEVTLNGTRTASANMSQNPALQNRPRSGYIGIGNWHGEANGMTFRNIRIKELGAITANQPVVKYPESPVAASSGGTINFLALADPQQDAVKGNWKLTADGLVLEKPNPIGVLDLPYAPPEEYDFEIEFTPTDTGLNVNQFLSAGGCAFAWKVARKEQYAVIELLDGKFFDQRKEGVSEKTLALEPGRRYTSKVEVRRGSFRALVNGGEYLRWSGDFNRLSLEPSFKLRDNSHIGVGSVRRGVIFHRIEVREVSGKGTFARGAPAAQFTSGGAADAFTKEVAVLPAEQQVARVVAKLKELNPKFDGKETHKVEAGAVTELAISTTGVTDITPVRALKQLKKLTVAPWALNQKGSLADLSALKELPLAWLYCQNNPVSDLSPLRGLPLTVLGCGGTQVSDLSPLAGMKLTVLSVNDTSVSDLSPLNGMPLTVLWCNNTWVADFTPLKGLPLQELKCNFQPQRDADALRDIPTLRKINDQAAAVLLRQSAASAQAPRTAAPSGDIRVLIVTGVDSPAHDWRSTGPAIREEMQKDSRMKVEILNDPYRLDSMDLTKFQVVLLNFYTKDKPDPNEQARDNLKNFVNRGGGLVVFHSTCGSFRDWPEFRDLAGKIMSHQKPAMDRAGPMRVKIVNQNHPITRGMQSYEVVDELYAFLTGRKPVEVLATAHAKSTGSDEPMAFVLTYGQGRVFHIVLGHTVGAIQTPGTAELLRRGAAWVAGREPAPLTATPKR